VDRLTNRNHVETPTYLRVVARLTNRNLRFDDAGGVNPPGFFRIYFVSAHRRSLLLFYLRLP